LKKTIAGRKCRRGDERGIGKLSDRRVKALSDWPPVTVEFTPIASFLPAAALHWRPSAQSNRRTIGQIERKAHHIPSLGLVAPRSTETNDGVPEGPLTVAPVSDEEIAVSFNPNGEPATSSATFTEVGVGEVMTRRPRPLVPMSACGARNHGLIRPGCWFR